MPELFSALDLVVLPSYREGFGNVLIEAAAMGVPVVATSIPGCVDAVRDNVTGTLIPPHDAFELARGIERYMNDSELRRKHGVRARERVLRDFRAEPIWEFISAEYNALLSHHGLPSPALSSAGNRSASDDAVSIGTKPNVG